MKTIFVTYRISLTNKIKEKQVLSYFNGENDLIDVVNEYCKYIHQNIVSYLDNRGNRRTFTLDGVQVNDLKGRMVYGYFDSAYTGEKIKIKEGSTNDLIYDVKLRDLQSRSFFFLVHVPKNSKEAYIVIEKKSNHAVKGALTNSFNEFLRVSGFIDYRITLEQAPSYYLLNRMIQLGNLKEVRMSKSSIMSSFQKQFLNIGLQNSGVFEQTMKFNNESRTESFKSLLLRLYYAKYLDYQPIQIFEENFDEISFIMELNEVTKTFYIKDKSKIRSNADVTNLLSYQDGQPTLQSLLDVSIGIIAGINPNKGDDDTVAA